jgi:ADP-heptose:LPS heptosyltransferase
VTSPRYALFQLAAVVGVATSAVNIAEVLPANIVMVFAPEDCTVTSPVELFTMVYCAPAATDVVGSLTI